MAASVEEAKKSAVSGQYAIGAVVVDSQGNIISIAHTTISENKDATEHAEMNAIREACKVLNSQYLENCWLYTTLEPCTMCTSAAIWAKMKGIVFGASQKDARDFSWRQIDISAKEVAQKGNPKLEIIENFMREECKNLFDL